MFGLKIRRAALALFAYAVFLTGLVFLADAGRAGRMFALVNWVPGRDKTGHFILFGVLSFLVNDLLRVVKVRWGWISVLKGNLIVMIFAADFTVAREIDWIRLESMNELSEIIFEVHEADEGGYWAKALGFDIFTQGEDWEDLKAMAKDAVNCWFENPQDKPKLIRLHLVKDELVAA